MPEIRNWHRLICYLALLALQDIVPLLPDIAKGNVSKAEAAVVNRKKLSVVVIESKK